MTETVRRTISLKLGLTEDDEFFLKNYLEQWGVPVEFTFQHIKKIYDSYEKLEIPEDNKCSDCGELQRLTYYSKKTKSPVCGKCFFYKWSLFTLLLKDNFLKTLIEKYPKLATNKGYYHSVIKYAVPAFKSWLSKRKDREKEIEQLGLQIKSCTEPLKQLKLEEKLKYKMKGIKDFEFRKNVLFCGNAGMFDLKKEGEKYYLGISEPHILREKRWFLLKLGKRESYKTQHNKFEIIDHFLETKEHKKFSGKILNRKIYLEFMLPKRDESSSLIKNSDVETYLKKHPDTPIVCFSFGIKQPIKIVVFDKGKVQVKKFGDGSFFHRVDRERKYRAKVMKIFAKRYTFKDKEKDKWKGKWRKRKAIKKFFKKRGNLEANYIKDYSHKLTTDVITWISENVGNCVIVMRDTKGIKRINYPPIYKNVMYKWNLEFQKSLLEYKLMLKNLHFYVVPYNKTNNLCCSKCGEQIKDVVTIEKEYKEAYKSIDYYRSYINEKYDKLLERIPPEKEPLKTVKKIKKLDRDPKVLTIKLSHAMDRKSFYRGKEIMLKKKLEKLFSYPDKEKHFPFIIKTAKELELIKEKLNNIYNANVFKRIECGNCGYQNSDFYVNDAMMLKKILDETIKNLEEEKQKQKQKQK